MKRILFYLTTFVVVIAAVMVYDLTKPATQEGIMEKCANAECVALPAPTTPNLACTTVSRRLPSGSMGETISVSCPSGYTLTGGTCSYFGSSDWPSGNGWACNTDGTGATVYARCCRL